MTFGSTRGIGTRIASAKTEATIKKLLRELGNYEYASRKTLRRLASRAKSRILELKQKESK